MAKEAETVWGAYLNQGGGLWTKKPVEFAVITGDLADTDRELWNRKLDVSAGSKVGLCIHRRRDSGEVIAIAFTSTDKRDVELFIRGARAMGSVVWAKVENFGFGLLDSELSEKVTA